MIRHSELVVADQNGGKLRTKSQKFELVEGANLKKVDVRAPRLTEKYDNLKETGKKAEINVKGKIQ